MENRTVNSTGIKIPKKPLSMDLTTTYNSGVSREPEERSLKRKSQTADGNEKRKASRRTKKEVSLSCIRDGSSRHNKKHIDEVYHDGLGMGSHVSKNSSSSLAQIQDNSSRLNGNPLSLNDNIYIPKRKRGFVGRSKYQRYQASKLEVWSTSEVGFVDQVAKSNCDKLGSRGTSGSVERKPELNNFKGKRIRELTMGQTIKEGSDHLVASDGNISVKKLQRKYRRKNVALRSPVQKDEPLVDNGFRGKRISELNLGQTSKEKYGPSDCLTVRNDDLAVKKSERKLKRKSLPRRSIEKKADPLVINIQQSENIEEDDEENLEETAAMMLSLSSHFDPSCTGVSSSSRCTVSRCNAALPLLSSAGQHITDQGSKSFPGSESASLDADSRVLRPRKEHREKGFKRKRRHYYEISSGNLDGHWLLNRRIKVFWPLDETWYDGLVNDYNEGNKLHHVKYDDRDEEWINLRTERFKLLLLRSEVPSKIKRKRSAARDQSSDKAKGKLKPIKDKNKEDMVSEDDSYRSNFVDSEPIISWLARTTQRFDSPPISLKKQKTIGFCPNYRLPFSKEPVGAPGFTEQVFKRTKNVVFSNSASTKSMGDHGKAMKQLSDHTACSRYNKAPIVYSRRRFHKRGDVSEESEAVTCISFFDKLLALEERDICELHHPGPFWLVDDSGLKKFTITFTESREFTFELTFLGCSIPEYTYAAENIRLCRAVMLHKHGTMVNVWPQVHLEMLSIDNIDGLRFLSFQGCLKQAVTLIFLVLTVFTEPANGKKFVDWQLPVTSVSFKFSSIQGIRKQFVFYNFSEVKHSKWIHLDSKLKNLRRCLLLRQLPLSECTFDNIKAFQNGTKQMLPSASSPGWQSSKGIERRSRRGISCMGVSRECTSVNAGCSSKPTEMYKKFPSFSLSFAAAPSFFLNLHLRLLMKRSISYMCFLDCNSFGNEENNGSSITEYCTGMEDFCIKALTNKSVNDPEFVLKDVTHGDCVSHSETVVEAPGFSVHGTIDWLNSSQPHDAYGPCTVRVSAHLQGLAESGSDAGLGGKKSNHMVLDSPVLELRSSSDSAKSAMESQISIDLSVNANGGSIIPSANPTGPRSMWHRNRSRGTSGNKSHGWSDSKGVLNQNVSGRGTKRPKTQVVHLCPSRAVVSATRPRVHLRRDLSQKHTKKYNEKKLSNVFTEPERNLESLYCKANLLLTKGNKGWREHGARVVLEFSDHTEWKLAIKLDGITEYLYKPDQFLHPGSANRHTHAMMWKGGKDWILEFPNRSQWALFKEMHEECYNRNTHSALKSIPIPGVRLIEENGDNEEISFAHNFCKYFQQVETDVEMALKPSRILYDMDSDDEQWLKGQNSSGSYGGGLREISEEFFEKAMDMFEKISYVQQRDQFTPDEVENLMNGVGSTEIIKIIYEHWQKKRQNKRMPLIRHFQPPLWQRYQQQVREWEQSTTKINNSLSYGSIEKSASIKKPAMFAFCLKPCGLEVRNKGSKQRPHKKILVSGRGNAALGDRDGYHGLGKNFQGLAFGNENDGSLDESPLYETSPRDMRYSLISRSKSKKSMVFVSPYYSQVASYSQRMLGNRKGSDWWNQGVSERSNQSYQFAGLKKYGFDGLDGSDYYEFRLRDPSSAAKRAVKMAKITRERADRLHNRADLAIQRAAEALMAAEAFSEAHG